MTNPGSTLERGPSGGEAAEFQKKEPWASRAQAGVQVLTPQLNGSETLDKYFPLGLRFLICIMGIMLQNC